MTRPHLTDEIGQAQSMSAPTFFLDVENLPPWLVVQHASVELYAQAILHGQANGPRRFLGILPEGALLPQLRMHAQWRICVVPADGDCMASFAWPCAELSVAQGNANSQSGDLEWQAAIAALMPFLTALQDATRSSQRDFRHDLIPSLSTAGEGDNIPKQQPLGLVQNWVHDSLAHLRDQRQPLPIAEVARANQTARNVALQKLKAVLQPRAATPSMEQDGLAALACEVARAQGLRLNKGAAQTIENESLTAWAQRAGVRLRRVALRANWWRSSALPLLASLPNTQSASNQTSPIALLPCTDGSYVWRKNGSQWAPLSVELAEKLSPFAWSMHGRLPERILHLRDLLSFGWRAALADMLLLGVCALAAGLLGAISPMAVAYVFKTVMPSSELALLTSFATLIAGLAVLGGILHLSADLAALRIEGRLGNGLQSAMFDRLLRLPLGFFSSLSSGDLANRIATLDMVRRNFASLIVLMITALCYTLGALATISYYMPKAALWVGLAMLLLWCLAAVLGWRQVRNLYEGEQIEGNIISLLVQLLQGISKLRLAGAEDRGFGLWGRGFAEMRSRLTRGRLLQVHFSALLALAELAMSAIVFAVFGYSQGEKPSTSEFLALLAALATFSASGLSLGQAIARVIMMKPFFERIRPLLNAIPAEAQAAMNTGLKSATNQAINQEVNEATIEPTRLNGGIEVVHLAFAYQMPGPMVLRDISLQIKPGQFVAIVGVSGCGKSTFLRLLLGLEQARSGSIYYDGRDLSTLNIDALRRQIGVVLQNGRSLPGSLYENISLAHACTLEQAWQAARLAGLEEDIRAMPMGMHTILSEGSAALSGGQVQRLLLARALAGQPKILFLDEATSALDNLTQARVISSLAAMKITRIVSAHRLSTVQKADQIIVLHEGMIVERGNFAELMELDEHFARLARRQLT